MTATYTTKQASGLTGASRQAIRGYTARYARYFTTDATPDQGQERRFTADDLKLIAFVYQRTRSGQTHDDVCDQLVAGALDNFDWTPETPEPRQDATETTGALVPIERLQAAAAMLQDAQRREQDAIARAETLQGEITRLTLELGQAQGESETLKASRYRAPRWWRLLFGGSGE